MRPKYIAGAIMLVAGLSYTGPVNAQDDTGVLDEDTVIYEDDVDFAYDDDVFRGSLGMRAGFALNPNQIALGVQSRFGALFGGVQLAPSFDFGFGDDQTVFSLNADLLATLFTPPHSNARFYAAAGPTLQISNPKGDGTNTDLGLSISAGVRLPFADRNSYNLETRFGIGDIQEVRFLFGVLFGIQVDPGASPSTSP